MPQIPGFPEKPHYNSVETYLLELAKDIAEMVVDPTKMGRFREQLKIYAHFWKEWKTAEEADLKRCWKPEMGRPEYVFNVFSLSYNPFKDPQKEAKRLAGSYALCAFVHDSQLPHLEKINENIVSEEAIKETLSAPDNMLEDSIFHRRNCMYVIEMFFNYVKVDMQEFCKTEENKLKLNAIEQEIQQANKLSDIEFLELTAAKFEERSKKILPKNETWHDLDRSLKGWFESAIGRLEKLGFKDKVGLLKYFYQNLLHFAEGINIRSFRGFPDSSIVTSATKYANELSEKIKEAIVVNKNDKPQKGTYKAQQELAIKEADKLAADAALNLDKDLFLLYVYVAEALNYAVDIAKMTRSKESLSVEQFVAKQVRLFEYVKRIETYPNIIKLLERWPSDPGITFAWLSGQNALEVAVKFAKMISTSVIVARNERAFHGVTSYDNLIVCPKPNSVFEEWQVRTIKELLAHEIPKPDIWPSMADIHRESQSLLYKLQDEYNRAINVKNQNSENKVSSIPQKPPKMFGDTITTPMVGLQINWRVCWNKLKNLPLYLRTIIIILILIITLAIILRKPLWNIVTSNIANNASIVSSDLARNIIQQYFHYKQVDIDISCFAWLDLSSSGKKTEFYAKYNNGERDAVDVFTLRQGAPENIFHYLSQAEDLKPAHFSVNDKTYFVFATKAGSGSFLSINIYSYDGISKLRLIDDVNEFLFQGDLWVIDNRVFISGANRKYELKMINSEFKLQPYLERLHFNTGSGSHILAYHIVKDKLEITYDDQRIEFAKLKDPNNNIIINGRWMATNPIEIGIDEQIIIDDNITDCEGRAIRLLADGDVIDFKDGFYSTMVPNRKGKLGLMINDSYGDWYEIDMIIN
jgi:hypothetical protein